MEPRADVPITSGWPTPTGPVKPLSAEQAAKVLRMRPQTVRALLRSGRLAGVEVTPRRWKTTEAACQRFLEGQVAQ